MGHKSLIMVLTVAVVLNTPLFPDYCSQYAPNEYKLLLCVTANQITLIDVQLHIESK